MPSTRARPGWTSFAPRRSIERVRSRKIPDATQKTFIEYAPAPIALAENVFKATGMFQIALRSPRRRLAAGRLIHFYLEAPLDAATPGAHLHSIRVSTVRLRSCPGANGGLSIVIRRVIERGEQEKRDPTCFLLRLETDPRWRRANTGDRLHPISRGSHFLSCCCARRAHSSNPSS